MLLLHKAPKNRLMLMEKNKCMIGQVCVSSVCYLIAFKKKESQSKLKKLKDLRKSREVSEAVDHRSDNIQAQILYFLHPPPLIHSCTSCLTCPPPSPVCSQHVGR